MIKKIVNKYPVFSSKLFKDSFWSLIGNVIGKGLALVAGIFIARFLGKDIFGEYGIIRNTILTIGVFSTFGLGYTATKFVAEFKLNQPKKIRLFIKYANQITLIFSGFMALFLFLFADAVAIHILEIPSIANALRILSILIIFNAVTTTQIGVLAGLGKFKQLAKISTLVGALTFVLSIVLTYLFDLEGALLALLFVQIVNCIANYVVVKKTVSNLNNHIKSDTKLFKGIVTFSFPIALQECSYAVASWISSVLLIRYGSVGDLGMYTAAMQWNAIILFIPGILRNVILSHLAANNTNSVQHSTILKQTLKINFVATSIPCIVVILAMPLIVSSYGNSFVGLGSLISIAVFSTIFSSLSNVYAQAFTSIGKNWLMLGIRLTRDFLLIILFIVLINSLDINSAKLMIYCNIGLSIFFTILSFNLYNIVNNKQK